MTTRNPHHKPHRRTKRTRKNERVALAKDVLAQLDANRFTATTGVYVGEYEDAAIPTLLEKRNGLQSAVQDGVYNFDSDKYEYDDKDKVALKKFDKQFIPPPIKCDVCAIGAVFVAALDVHNKLKLSDLDHTDGYDSMIDDNDMIKYLRAWFTESELREMEGVFENNWEGTKWRDSILSKPNPKKLEEDDRIMRGIMQRVIDLKGAEFTNPLPMEGM